MEDFELLINKKTIEFENQIKSHLKSMSIKRLTLLGIDIVNIDEQETIKIMETLFLVEKEFNQDEKEKFSMEEPLENLINNIFLHIEKKKALEAAKECIAIASILQLMNLTRKKIEDKTYQKQYIDDKA